MRATGGVWLTSAALVALVAFTQTPAHAEASPVSVALTYDAPPGCTSEREVKRAVEARLARSPFVEQGADVLVEVTVKARANTDAWVANVTLRAQSGNWLGARELQTESTRCADLDEPLSLVLALMVDVPKEELPPPQVTAVETPPPAPRVLRVPAPPVALKTPSPPAHATQRTALHGELGVSGVLSAGLLPDLAVGVRGSILLRPPEFWPVELGAVLYRAAEAQVSGGGSDFEAAGADIAVCPFHGDLGSFRVLACAVQSLGRLKATGFGFDENREHARFYSLFGARARLSLGLTSWLAGRVSASAEVPVTRDDFYFVNAQGERERVFRSAPVVASGELGIELRF